MSAFKYNEKEFSKVKKTTIIEFLFGGALLVGYVIWLFTLGSPDVVYAVASDEINAVIITIIFLIPLGIFYIKRQKKALSNYLIVIEEDLIKIIQDSKIANNIFFSEITAIIQDKKGNFIIKFNDERPKITISKNIADYKTLEKELKNITPFNLHNQFDIKELEHLLPSISICLIVCIWISNNKNHLIFLCLLLFIETCWRIKIIIRTPVPSNKKWKIFMLIFYSIPTLWILTYKF